MFRRTIIAIIALSAWTITAAASGPVRRNPHAIPNEYIVVFNDDFPAADVAAAASELAGRHGNGLRRVWTHAIKGFYVLMTEGQAEGMSHDPRVKYVEENAGMFLSAIPDVEDTGYLADPQQPDFEDVSAGDDVLWHLDRIDQRAATPDFLYHQCPKGSGVTVYLVDTGVKSAHNEFTANSVTIGYTAGEGGPWMPNPAQFAIGDRIRDTINGNTWICISVPAGHTKGHTGTSTPNFSGGLGTVTPLDGEVAWQNFGKRDAANDPCEAGAGSDGWPATVVSGQPDFGRYIAEINNFGHGTSTASLIIGQHVGVAKEAKIVPIKVARCDGVEPRTLQVRDYKFGERIIATESGHIWICEVAGHSGSSSTQGWSTIGGAEITPDPVNSLKFRNLGPPSNVPMSMQMAIDGIDWILGPDNTNDVNHSIASFSTYRSVGESGLTGANSYEEAVQSLINAGVTVFASANNQDGDACQTSPARLSRGNTDATLGQRKVITVGGTMRSNANGVEGRWVCAAPDVCDEPGSNSGNCVSLFAPARNIRAALFKAQNQYRRFVAIDGIPALPSGTSWSAPIAAGVAAQFVQTKRDATPDEVYNAIINSALAGGLDPTTLQGNAPGAAPNRLLQTTEVWIYSDPNPAAQVVPNNTTLTLSVSASSLFSLSYQWYRGAALDTTHPLGTSASQAVTVTSNETYWCRVSTSGGCGGISSVDSPLYSTSLDATPPPAPTNVVATATTNTNVHLTWTAASGASSYRVYRRSAGGTSYTALTPTVSALFFDDAASAGAAYLYKVRAIAGGVESVDSNVDLATTVIFTEPITLNPPVPIKIKYVHFNELLTAVNAVRALAGSTSYSSISFTAPVPAQDAKILGAHITDLRNGLNPARTALGLSALTFTDPVISVPPSPNPTVAKAVHVKELDDGVQ